MKRSTTISAAILFVMSGFIGCNQPKPKSEGFITVDVTATYPKKELILQDFMDVEYIPLESTDSFITMAHVQDPDCKKHHCASGHRCIGRLC